MSRPREGWLSLVALVALTLAPALSLVAAGWVDNLTLVPWLTVVAVLVGFTLAKSRLSALLAHPLALLLGEATAVYLVAQTLPGRSIGDRLLLLGQRLWGWIDVVRGGGIGTDNLLFLLLLACLAWFVGYFSAWSVYRDRVAWWAILASGAALMVNTSYSPGQPAHYVAFLFAALVLIIRMNLLAHEDRWRSLGIRSTTGVVGGVLRAGVIVAAALVAVSWLAPPASAQQIGRLTTGLTQPWRDVQAQFNRLFGSVGPRSRDATSGFSETLALRGSFRLPPDPVFEVESAEPHYWRAITYQTYTGQGWLVAIDRAAREVQPNEPEPTSYRMRKDLQQTFHVIRPRGDQFLAANAPTLVDTPATLDIVAPAIGGTGPLADDRYVALTSVDPILADQLYAVVSAVSFADEQSLRLAGEDYPDWVADQYLGLPPIPPRVRNLAERLTEGQTNAYDRALAIEAYLRTLRYDLDVEPPPTGVDGVDHFLFTTREGYCDYFASAMVVMLRSVGVPARVASGYTTGELQADGTYLVRDANAHSWVEVFFPDYGWIIFEPSSIQLTVRRAPDRSDPEVAALLTPTPEPVPVTPTPNPAETDQARADEERANANPLLAAAAGLLDRPLGRLLLIALAFLAALVGLAWLALNWGTRGMSPEEAGYTRLSRLAAWLGRGQGAGETPYEYATSLARLAPRAAPDIVTIADHFARRRFARTWSATAAADVHRAWVSARGHLLRACARIRRGR